MKSHPEFQGRITNALREVCAVPARTQWPSPGTVRRDDEGHRIPVLDFKKPMKAKGENGKAGNWEICKSAIQSVLAALAVSAIFTCTRGWLTLVFQAPNSDAPEELRMQTKVKFNAERRFGMVTHSNKLVELAA